MRNLEEKLEKTEKDKLENRQYENTQVYLQ
jgi:hypothetical protein